MDIYKASELGKGRNMMASKIEATWNRLHNQSEVLSINCQRPNGQRNEVYNNFAQLVKMLKPCVRRYRNIK